MDRRRGSRPGHRGTSPSPSSRRRSRPTSWPRCAGLAWSGGFPVQRKDGTVFPPWSPTPASTVTASWSGSSASPPTWHRAAPAARALDRRGRRGPGRRGDHLRQPRRRAPFGWTRTPSSAARSCRWCTPRTVTPWPSSSPRLPHPRAHARLELRLRHSGRDVGVGGGRAHQHARRPRRPRRGVPPPPQRLPAGPGTSRGTRRPAPAGARHAGDHRTGQGVPDRTRRGPSRCRLRAPSPLRPRARGVPAGGGCPGWWTASSRCRRTSDVRLVRGAAGARNGDAPTSGPGAPPPRPPPTSEHGFRRREVLPRRCRAVPRRVVQPAGVRDARESPGPTGCSVPSRFGLGGPHPRARPRGSSPPVCPRSRLWRGRWCPPMRGTTRAPHRLHRGADARRALRRTGCRRRRSQGDRPLPRPELLTRRRLARRAVRRGPRGRRHRRRPRGLLRQVQLLISEGVEPDGLPVTAEAPLPVASVLAPRRRARARVGLSTPLHRRSPINAPPAARREP